MNKEEADRSIPVINRWEGSGAGGCLPDEVSQIFQLDPHTQHTGHKIEGLLPLFWDPALHIPFKKEGIIFCKPFKTNGKKKVSGP